MPAYAGVINSTVRSPIPGRSLAPGESAPVFGTWAYPWRIPEDVTPENTPANGTASVPVCINPSGDPGIAPSVDVEIVFLANPGVLSIAIQEADEDSDAMYITPAAAAYTVAAVVQKGALYIARVDLSPTGGKFLRILATTITNQVTWYVIITRK